MRFDLQTHASLIPLRRVGSDSGMSLLSVMVGMGLAALAVTYGLSMMNHSFQATRFVTDNADASDTLNGLFRYFHKTFQRRTQIDLETGVGIYSAVAHIRADDLIYGGFQIETRSSQNLTQLITYRFENVCAPVESHLSIPSPPIDAYPNLGSCLAPNRWTIQIVSSAQPSRRIIIGRGKIGALSSIFRIRSISNDNVSLLVAIAQRGANGKVHWQMRDLEIWDEMPRQGVEFLQ